jgi:hypothetical protein
VVENRYRSLEVKSRLAELNLLVVSSISNEGEFTGSRLSVDSCSVLITFLFFLKLYNPSGI